MLQKVTTFCTEMVYRQTCDLLIIAYISYDTPQFGSKNFD